MFERLQHFFFWCIGLVRSLLLLSFASGTLLVTRSLAAAFSLLLRWLLLLLLNVLAAGALFAGSALSSALLRGLILVSLSLCTLLLALNFLLGSQVLLVVPVLLRVVLHLRSLGLYLSVL